MAIENTLSIIKPDATKRNLTGLINAKFEKHEKKAALSGSSYMSRGITITTDLITKEEVEGLRKEVLALKRARQDTNDKVLELNVSTYVVLSDDEVKLLSDEGLI